MEKPLGPMGHGLLGGFLSFLLDVRFPGNLPAVAIAFGGLAFILVPR
jgi:hypothetical protein